MSEYAYLCPFCGGSAETMTDDVEYWGECTVCGACGPAEDNSTAAVEAWNDRYAVVGRSDRDTYLVKEALQRHGHYLVSRLKRPSARPNGADAHALERLRGLMRYLGFIASDGKDFW